MCHALIVPHSVYVQIMGTFNDATMVWNAFFINSAVLLEEFDASPFQGCAYFARSLVPPTQQTVMGFQTLDGRYRHARSSCQLPPWPRQERSCR